jgi:hypothetical protein
LAREVRRLPQPDRWQKQKCEPYPAAYVTRHGGKEPPGYAANCEDDNRGNAPFLMSSAWTPGPDEHEQGRDHRDEEQNVIQIHETSG